MPGSGTVAGGVTPPVVVLPDVVVVPPDVVVVPPEVVVVPPDVVVVPPEVVEVVVLELVLDPVHIVEPVESPQLQ